MKKGIIVIGGGGHAKVIISILKKNKEYQIVGFTDVEEKEPILGVPYLGDDNSIVEYYDKGVFNLAIGIGQIKDTLPREKIVNKLLSKGFFFPPIISRNSIVNENVSVGNGTVIMDGVIINSGTKIGEYSIVNTNASIDHDCFIGNFTHIAPGVTLSGDVRIGNNVLVGTGANIIQCISVTDNALVSAGSSVQEDIKRPGIYRGVPTVFIRNR